MYKVTIINGNESIDINDGYFPRNKIIGNIHDKKNRISTFNFTIYPGNDGFGKIEKLKTIVRITDTATNNIEFEGRVITPTGSMSQDGIAGLSYSCNSALDYLNDTIVPWEHPAAPDLDSYIRGLLTKHNNLIEDSSKKIYANSINTSSKRKFAFDYVKTFEALQEIAEKCYGTFKLHSINGVNYLDYSDNTTSAEIDGEIELGVNMVTMSFEENINEFATCIIPLGDYIDTSKGKDRYGISDTYVANSKLVAKYGKIYKKVIYDGYTGEYELNAMGSGDASSLKDAYRQISAQAIDLSKIREDYNAIKVGTRQRVINPKMMIDEVLEVVELNRDISNPAVVDIVFGDTIPRRLTEKIIRR